MTDFRLNPRRERDAHAWLQRNVFTNETIYSLSLKAVKRTPGRKPTEEHLEGWSVDELQELSVDDLLAVALDHAPDWPKQKFRMIPAGADGEALTTKQKPHTLSFDAVPAGVTPGSSGPQAATEARSAAGARMLGAAAVP